MGYLGSNASFTGTQNNKRVTVTATQGQTLFTVSGGYAINAIDVYRNGVKLSAQRDFTALDGATVTLVSAANADDNLEFVIFENFQREDVVTGDGDSVIKGNLEVAGDLGITGTLNATVSNTNTAGFSSISGISTQVSGFLGVGVTGTNLNVTGVITANSFSGDGSNLTGIAATDDVSTNGLVVLGISTLAGATFSGVTTHSANNVFNSTVSFNDNATFGDDDVLNFGASSDGRIFFQNSENEFHVRVPGGTGKLTLGAGAPVQITNEDGNTNRAVFTNGGAVITGVATADGFRAGDSEKVELGAGQDLQIYHNGTHSYIDNQTGALILENNVNDNDIILQTDDGSGGLTDYIQCDGSTGEVKLFHYGSEKLETASGGINVGVGITMDGNGIAVSGILTSNGITVGQNAIGARTVQSGGSPSGGSNGDIYYIY
jgi:hypothetical protein